MSPTAPNREQLLEMMAAFQPACVLGAAAELDVFAVLGDESLAADTLAERVAADRRGTIVLLDALVALGVLEKRQGQYSVPAELRQLLTMSEDETILPMVRHRMNMMRHWTQLAATVRSGEMAPRQPSICGAAADRAAFVAAMHTASDRAADKLIARFAPPRFSHLLDVGGASGTWTMALLRAMPGARATLFDLPDALPQAEERLARSELADRVTLVAGDFYRDALPGGADLAWLGAIVHQNSRAQNRALFEKVYAALVPGGRVAARDIVMTPDRTEPLVGALFAVNMLVNTPGGGTFTFGELAKDLQAAGFSQPEWVVRDDGMNSIVTAVK